MTDPTRTGPQDPGQEPDEAQFDDPAYDGIRDLLAGARVTEPVPAEVAARLEETLATLSAARRTESDPAPSTTVVPLRRRSRLAPRLLAAAAAVVVVGGGGIGIAQLLGTESSDLATATAGSAESDGASTGGDLGPVTPQSSDSGATAPKDPAVGEKNLTNLRVAALPSFTTAGFAREAAAFDLARIPASLSAIETGTPAAASPAPGTFQESAPDRTDDFAADGGERSSATNERLNAYTAARAACPGPVGLGAVLVPITFDGTAASLAVYPAGDDGQVLEAWSCDGARLLATTVVPR